MTGADEPTRCGTEPVTHRVRMRCDLHETPEGWSIFLSVPGVKQEDLDLTVEGGSLTVRALRRQALQDGAKVVLGRHGDVRGEREFVLPDGVGPDQISAELAHGLLHLKLEPTLPRRATIPVERRS